MSKSLLYAANTTNQTVAVGGTINFGSVIRRHGCNCNLSNGDVTICGSGYYVIDTNITVTPSDAGTLVLTITKDGVTIPGAIASVTVVAGSVYAISIPTAIRECGCCDSLSNVKVVLSGVAATVNNASIIVTKE